MFKICSKPLVATRKTCPCGGVYGHILSARACFILRAMDVRVTEPSTPGGRVAARKGWGTRRPRACAAFCMHHDRRAAPTLCFRPARSSYSCMRAFGTAVRIARLAATASSSSFRGVCRHGRCRRSPAPPSRRFTGSRMDFRSIAGAPRCTTLELAVVDHQG